MSSMSQGQQRGCRMFAEMMRSDSQKVLSIIGPAGSGKTWLMRELVNMAKTDFGVTPAMSASTHKACGVLHKATGMDVDTIHSKLKACMVRDLDTGTENLVVRDDVFDDEQAFPDLVVCDESSMNPNSIVQGCAALAKHQGVKFVFVGDAAQLSPVGEETSMTVDVNRCPWPYAELDTIFRQGEGSPIIEAATALRTSSPGAIRSLKPWAHRPGTPLNEPGIHVLGKHDFMKLYARLTSLGAQQNDPDFAKYCSYTNLAADTANVHARKSVYGNVAAQSPYLRDEFLTVGSRYDPVACENSALTNGCDVRVLAVAPTTVNNALLGIDDRFGTFSAEGYAVIAEHTDIYTGWTEEKELVTLGSYAERQALVSAAKIQAFKARGEGVRRPWEKYFALQDCIADVRPVFASTTHKSQGSTYQYAFLSMREMMKCTNRTEYNKLLYVALTRAAKAVYVFE